MAAQWARAGRFRFLLGLILYVPFRYRDVIYRTVRDTLHNIAEFTRNTLGARMTSYIMSCFASKVLDDTRQIFRQAYAHLGRPMYVKAAGHSHPRAAAVRRCANSYLSAMAPILGKRQFSVSSSKTDEVQAIPRIRHYHFAKDLQYDYCNKRITSEHLITMTDVDYYVHMPDYLRGNTVAISTFVPQEVCGMTEDASYTIDSDDNVVTHVNGGGKYTHQLWDYETDHLTVDHIWGSVLYLIERFKFSNDRYVIIFVPMRYIYGPLAWILPGKRLTRRKFVTNGYAHSRYHHKVQKMTPPDIMVVRHSIGKLNSFSSVTVTDSLLQTIFTRLRVAKTPQVSDVERLVRSAADPEITDSVYAATTLYDFYKANLDFFAYHYSPISAYADDDGYQTTKPLATEDGKAVTRRVMPPVIDDGYHPLRSHNNETNFVDGRILNVKNLTPTHKIPPRYWVYLNEFVDQLVGPHRGTLAPLTHEEMMVNVSKRGPKAVLRVENENFFPDDGAIIKSFQKAETYGKITATRGICTLPIAHNFRLGQFVYPFAEHIMKPQPWYAFGSHPQELGTRLQDICENEESLTNSDINKNDGSVHYISHALDVSSYNAAYAPKYHAELDALLQAETRTKSITTSGIVTKMDNVTNSGSSITSDKNSRLNAYVAYCALRDKGYDSREAYAKLGLYGGDDGESRGINAEELTRAFANIGMLSTAVTVPIFSPVPFLGRLFLNPWTTPESVHDVRRALSKFHLASAPKTIPDDLILVRKATGYLVTDPDTPLLSNFCKAVIRCFKNVNLDGPHTPEVNAILARESSYFSRWESPFPKLVSMDTARSAIIENMDCSEEQFDNAIQYLDKIKNFSEFEALSGFFHANNKVQVTATHRGELKIGTDDPPADPATSKHQMLVAANKPPHPHLSQILVQAQLPRTMPVTARAPKTQPEKSVTFTAKPPTPLIPRVPPKTEKAKKAKSDAKVAQVNNKATPDISQSAKTGHAVKHVHQCLSCRRHYSHIHRFVNIDDMFPYDCPNPMCIEYHGFANPKSAVLLERQWGDARVNPTNIGNLMRVMHEATGQGSATSHINSDVVTSDNSVVSVTATPSQIVLIKEEKPKAQAPKFDTSAEADKYYGNTGHELCCRRCGKWGEKWVEDGRCERYPRCKGRPIYEEPTTIVEQNVTVIQAGEEALTKHDLLTPGQYKSDLQFDSVDFNDPESRKHVTKSAEKLSYAETLKVNTHNETGPKQSKFGNNQRTINKPKQQTAEKINKQRAVDRTPTAELK